MANIDIEMSEFANKTTLANNDYVVVSLENGTQGKIKVSDLASVVAGVLGVANIEFHTAVFDKQIWVCNFSMNNKSAAYYNHIIVIKTDGSIYCEKTEVYSGGGVSNDNRVSFEDGLPAGYKILIFTLCFN